MVVTFCGEMVAKLKSNDYFASTIILRSTKDSYRNKVIPYVPTVEGSCSAYHKFGRTTAARIHLRFAGERKADLIEIVTLPQYVVVDISGEYTPFDFLRFTVGIKNLTGMRYEIWRGYQEFPMTMHVSLQIKW
jgi:outer membrane receptor protein involved in Fe transport